MKVTCLGHAGLFVETEHGSIVCDPWFGPAFYGSWFPFPDNSELEEGPWRSPDYVYVSHTHPDHFDPKFLASIDKRATAIVPEFPLSEIRQKLRKAGFSRLLHPKHGVPMEIGGLTITVFANSSPADGPMGDSTIVIDDGETRIVNQNDSRPYDLDAVKALGPYDAHFAQHSGAVWWPMVYRMPNRKKQMLGRRKRKNQTDRFLHYVDAIGATFVVPNSGPPCFLDDRLWELNDLGDLSNVFPDQSLALKELWPRGGRGQSMLPGSVAEITPDSFDVNHRMTDEMLGTGPAKYKYLREYAKRSRSSIVAEMDSLLTVDDLRESLQELFEPLLERTDRIAAGIGGLVVVNGTALDFKAKQVRRWDGEPFVQRIIVPGPILEDLVARKVENWVDDMWPSCRLEMERPGPYNDYVGSFFRCLTPERMEYAEEFYEHQLATEEWIELDGWRMQRRCPHLGSDLAKVGKIEGDTLTCLNHGLRFDLASGRCIDRDHLAIRAERKT